MRVELNQRLRVVYMCPVFAQYGGRGMLPSRAHALWLCTVLGYEATSEHIDLVFFDTQNTRSRCAN